MVEMVTLVVDGQLHTGWKDVEITRTLNAVCSDFSVGVAQKIEGQIDRPRVYNGQAVTVKVGRETLITGWIDQIEEEVGPSSHSISVSGADKTVDIIECSAVHRPGTFKNQKIEVIANVLLKPFGLSLVVEAPTGAALPKFVLDPSETVAEAIIRAAKLRGLLLGSTADGQPRLFKPTPKPTGFELVEGVNLKRLRKRESTRERFSTYTIIGQQRGGNDVEPNDARAVSATATDPGVKRYRPLRIVSDDQSSLAGVQARSKWEASAHLAQAGDAEAEVAGWRDPSGALWDVGLLVTVRSARMEFDAKLMIREVRLRLSADSYTTSLVLCDPASFAPEPLEEPKPAKVKKAKKKKPADATAGLGGLS